MRHINMLVLILLLQACSSTPKQDAVVVYLSSWGESWKQAKVDACRKESMKLTYEMYKQHPYWTNEQCIAVRDYLMNSCVLHYKLDI